MNVLFYEEVHFIWHTMMSIQILFMAYFINNQTIFSINQSMFLWLYDNSKKNEILFGG